MKINKNFWKNKKVLIIGSCGFKGKWLVALLTLLKAQIVGINKTKIKNTNYRFYKSDICNLNNINKIIKFEKPEIIFHLAAQSSVIESFKNSHNTITSNIVGTANIMEVSKKYSFIKSVVIITTDKVYQNYKEKKYFDENSQLGGDDIYSGSKACCELLVHSYRKSFFQNSKCNIATVRAGNCFGGGDWTPDRIVKDILENFYKNKNLVLRNPNATRPWQHVLEPLMGYLKLAEKLHSKDGNQFCEPWNFGPSLKQNMKVKNLVEIFQNKMKSKSKIIINKNDKRFHNKKINIFESKNLNINSKKISKRLNWKPKLSLDNSIDLTVIWYKSFRAKKNVFDLTNKQIKYYLDL